MTGFLREHFFSLLGQPNSTQAVKEPFHHRTTTTKKGGKRSCTRWCRIARLFAPLCPIYLLLLPLSSFFALCATPRRHNHSRSRVDETKIGRIHAAAIARPAKWKNMRLEERLIRGQGTRHPHVCATRALTARRRGRLLRPRVLVALAESRPAKRRENTYDKKGHGDT